MSRLILALALFGTAQAACPNSCSGHGTCGSDDTCTCFQDWVMGDQNGGDCSDRKCPYEISWVSAPDENGFVHGYAECAGRGICDRSSGQCDCFDGFTGKACAYTTCPNECSGHGTCEYVEELTVGSVAGDYYSDVFKGFHTESVALDYVNTLWDAGKSRACLCDPMYTEVDCSRKMCSKGNDVLDTRSDTTDTLLYQVQNITINLATDETGEVKNFMGENATFSLIFKTTLNETYKTTPIVYSWARSEQTADAIEAALLALPNNAIDGVYVNSSSISGIGASLGSDGMNPASNRTTPGSFGTPLGYEMDTAFLVYFTGASVQGPQNLLMVDVAECKDGCTPMLNGIDVKSWGGTLSSVSEYKPADYNNYEVQSYCLLLVFEIGNMSAPPRSSRLNRIFFLSTGRWHVFSHTHSFALSPLVSPLALLSQSLAVRPPWQVRL